MDGLQWMESEFCEAEAILRDDFRAFLYYGEDGDGYFLQVWDEAQAAKDVFGQGHLVGEYRIDAVCINQAKELAMEGAREIMHAACTRHMEALLGLYGRCWSQTMLRWSGAVRGVSQ